MSNETRQQLVAQGWSERKIDEADLRRVERQIRATRDAAPLRSLGRRRRELKDKLA